jgi:hypothetical protein
MRVLVLIATILITTHASAYERFMSPDQRFEAYTTAAAADGTRMKLFLRRAQTHDAGVLLWENARWTDAKWSPDSRFLAAVDHMDGHIADVYVFGVTAAHDESKIAPEEIGYDAFISHASEDKEKFFKPLANALTRMEYRVWYDEFDLRVGDSLRQSVDKGLVNSRFGIVVLSPAFFAKDWPQYELNGLVAREMDGHKVILPIWHDVDREDVLAYSPTLADKVALSSRRLSIKRIAKALEEFDSE